MTRRIAVREMIGPEEENKSFASKNHVFWN